MTYHTEMESNVLKRLTERYMREVIQIGLYQKLIDEAVNHTPLEAELCRQIDKLNDRLDTQQNVIQTLSSIITKQVRV